MNITHVIRGNEYLSSTPKYNLIYQAFNWQIPTYIHVPPVMKDAQNKLSKRNGDASYQDLIKQGFLSEAIIKAGLQKVKRKYFHLNSWLTFFLLIALVNHRLSLILKN